VVVYDCSLKALCNLARHFFQKNSLSNKNTCFMAPKILLVEDEKKLANTIKAGLSEHNLDVHTAYDGREGKDLFFSNVFDLVILDINLPFINGKELCKTFRSKNPHVPIIILTAQNLLDNKLDSFDFGADDFISKPFEFRELLARIKALLRRTELTKTVTSEQFLSIANLELDLNRKEARRDGTKITLTAKEFQLLEFLLRNKEKVVSRDEIARSVWETEFDAQTNVIDVYVNFLRKKIDKNFEPKLIHTHVGLGYIVKADE
jgi:DNA-binding response OmpR family regulator